MAKLLVVYGTTEGHTRKIANAIGDWIGAAGATAVVLDAATALPGLLEEGEYDGAIVCGSVHQGKHSRPLLELVRASRGDLNRIPSAFVSVSMSEAMDDAELKAEAQCYIDSFVKASGWQPTVTESVAGALLYTQYDFMKRMMLRMIAESRGATTDTSRDWEFTDWDALEVFVRGFVEQVRKPALAGR